MRGRVNLAGRTVSGRSLSNNGVEEEPMTTETQGSLVDASPRWWRCGRGRILAWLTIQ